MITRRVNPSRLPVRDSPGAPAFGSPEPVAGNWQRLAGFAVAPGLHGRSVPVIVLWSIVQTTFFRWSPQIAYRWRNTLLRIFGARVGRGVKIRPTAKITHPWRLAIGPDCWIGDEVILYTVAQTTIESDVVVSQRSYLCSATHDYTAATFDTTARPITLRAGAWVATDVFIGPGVTIGSGTVVGARSSVFSDLPPGMVCYGYPARPIKKRVMRSGDSQ